MVDGQQRLTTLSLILIKLRHMAESYGSELTRWIDNKIAGQSGFKSEFWLNHEKHKNTQDALYKGELENIDVSSGITAENMIQNYAALSKWMESNIPTRHKLETFVFYFLRRLVLINLSVEQTDVPMVFEVINDRGVGLKPYEILKGKLLGQIDKVVLNKKNYNELWESRINEINSYAEDQIDHFFRLFLKAKFADTRKKGQDFDGDYHRIIFSNSFNDQLNLVHNQSGVVSFLEEQFSYYTELYRKFIASYTTDEDSAFTCNRVNDLDGGFLLILSACRMNDPEESKKLWSIPAGASTVFSLTTTVTRRIRQ